jgi:hypothetical protein
LHVYGAARRKEKELVLEKKIGKEREYMGGTYEGEYVHVRVCGYEVLSRAVGRFRHC